MLDKAIKWTMWSW